MKNIHRALTLTLGVFSLAMTASGCGYTRQSALPSDIKTIYVEPVQNKIELAEVYAYVPGLEAMINNALTARLNKDGNLRVVGEPEEADVILKATLRRFDQGGVRFSTLESVQEYRLFVTVEAELLHGKTQQLIWKEGNFTGDADYFVSDLRPQARGEAAERAVNRLAQNLVDRIVEDW